MNEQLDYTFSNKYQTWNDSYLLDIPIVDKQHKVFFELFDKLLLMNKQSENYTEILNVIEELESYATKHFNTEEVLMKKANFPDYNLHKEQHEIFIKRVSEFKIAYNYKNSILFERIIIFMRKWFLMHISEVDGRYVSSVQKLIQNRDIKNKQIEL